MEVLPGETSKRGEKQLLQPKGHPPREVSGWSLWKRSLRNQGMGYRTPQLAPSGPGSSADSRHYQLAPSVPK